MAAASATNVSTTRRGPGIRPDGPERDDYQQKGGVEEVGESRQGLGSDTLQMGLDLVFVQCITGEGAKPEDVWACHGIVPDEVVGERCHDPDQPADSQELAAVIDLDDEPGARVQEEESDRNKGGRRGWR